MNEEVVKIEATLMQLRSNPSSTRIVVVKKPVMWSRTVCNGENCYEKKRNIHGQMELVFKKSCCENCNETTAELETLNDIGLLRCQAIKKENCQVSHFT